MWYVARSIALLSILPLVATGCSLRILGVDKSALTSESGIDGGSGSNTGINAFSVLGAMGGSDTTADSYLSDGTTLTATWVDTSGEDSYEVKILDSTGSSTLCGPVTAAADSTSYTFTSCSLSHGVTYRIHVTAKNSTTQAAQSAYSNFQVGPFITAGDLTVNEWGVAGIPVSLSYAVGSSVSVQYVTVDSSAQAGSDYIHSPLSTLTIPAGQTSGTISVSLLSDRSVESSEQFRVELTSASGAGLLSTSAQVTVQDNDLSPASGFTQLDASDSHICAITTSGAAKCWGENNYGQLGDNTNSDQSIPTAVFGFSAGASQITAGAQHSCVVTTAGGAKCWGRNSDGQIGDNTISSQTIPTNVFGLSSGIQQIEAGESHTCALTTAGGVKCWGYNFNGVLGDNTITDSRVPVDVFGLTSGVSQITAGAQHNCALTTVGAVKCWGRNVVGQLGDNTLTTRRVPIDVVGLSSGVSQIEGGMYHTCALTTAGAVKCWGFNSNGQIGDNTLTTQKVPTDVIGLSSGVTRIGLGVDHSCAITTGGALKCWGANYGGQLGNNSNIDEKVPVDVSGLSSGISQVSGGSYFTCALASAGSIKCWGDNASGQLGSGLTNSRKTATDVIGMDSGIELVSAGTHHTCAVISSGGLKCWGYNAYGQLGDNSTDDRITPTDVAGISTTISQIRTGEFHSCLLTTSGGVKCWGYNAQGQLGDNSTTNRVVPTDVYGLTSGVSEITNGDSHSCALTTAGAVKCWGHNLYGQLGDNSTTNRLIPTSVSGLSSGVSHIMAGRIHTCALTTVGAVKCWGSNGGGQLGDNSTTNRLVPVDTLGVPSGVSQLSAGAYHTCLLTSAGAVKCWGTNSSGQLGDNTLSARYVPNDVMGLSSGVSQIFSGRYGHNCALTAVGAVKCWGANDFGQLGDHTFTTRKVPTEVLGLSSGVARISLGYEHSCAITTGGALKCWGNDSFKQIGDSYNTWIPQFVVEP